MLVKYLFGRTGEFSQKTMGLQVFQLRLKVTRTIGDYVLDGSLENQAG